MLDDDASPPSSQDLANDDFLFHLYRGSELLLDNRVHEAKQELEQALGLQPRDAKGQDLLAIVYFRLGLYPRAIAIYERLVEAHPETTTPRINLALCYLKTGQPQAARMELERVLERNPEHARAWGYLGLAFQRLGDVDRAVYAFRMGGHEGMARRLSETSPTVSHSTAPPRLRELPRPRSSTSSIVEASTSCPTRMHTSLRRARGPRSSQGASGCLHSLHASELRSRACSSGLFASTRLQRSRPADERAAIDRIATTTDPDPSRARRPRRRGSGTRARRRPSQRTDTKPSSGTARQLTSPTRTLSNRPNLEQSRTA
jgi:hypothetical protein